MGTAIERAQLLVEKFGTVEDRFFVMWGLWGWRVIRADMDICQGIADDMMSLVETSPEGNPLLSEAYWAIGCTAYYKGDFTSALDLLDRGSQSVEPELERRYALKTGQCCSVMCNSHAALAVWQLGCPDQAQHRAEEMIQLAKELSHPFTYAMGLFFRRQVLEFSGRFDLARESIEEEYDVCHENGFVFFEVHAIFGRGNYLLRQGKTDEARRLFDQGLEMLAATGGHLSMDHPYRNIAEGYLMAELHDDAIEWIDRGIDLVDNHNERGMESEFLRLRGELAVATGDQRMAEEYYGQALEVSRRQHAKSWQLRTAISFAKLNQRQSNDSKARQILASAYAMFTEGFDTADLVRAKSLLDELGARS